MSKLGSHITEDKMQIATSVFVDDYKFMIQSLQSIQQHLDKESCETDVRLCLDFGDYGDTSWIIRSGDSSYDQQHSQFCAASSIDIDYKIEPEADDILESMIDDILDQIAQES